MFSVLELRERYTFPFPLLDAVRAVGHWPLRKDILFRVAFYETEKAIHSGNQSPWKSGFSRNLVLKES